MDTGLKGVILAMITVDPAKIQGGSCPIFLAGDRTEQEKLSLLLARILGGTVHDLENGVLIISRH